MITSQGRRSALGFLPLLVMVAFSSCSFTKNHLPQNESLSLEQWRFREAESVMSGLSIDEKASQVLMTVIDGREHPPAYLERLYGSCTPGAILLFRYNIASTPGKTFRFLSDTQKEFSRLGLPVLFAIDHEGGDVYRTGAVTTRLPSQKEIARRFTSADAGEVYLRSSRELRSLGILLNLAPVTEVASPGHTDFLGSRTFSDNPDHVQAFSIAAVSGIQDAGVLATLKHFPSTGSSDPHEGLSVLSMEQQRFMTDYVKPFQNLLVSFPGAVLASHTIVPCIEPGVPFSLSEKGVTGVLRKNLGYTGLIITDDVVMKALGDLGYTPSEAAVAALDAGCDMVMTSDPRIQAVRNAIAGKYKQDPQFRKKIDDAVTRILKAKIDVGLPVTRLGKLALSQGMMIDLFSNEVYDSLMRDTERSLKAFSQGSF